MQYIQIRALAGRTALAVQEQLLDAAKLARLAVDMILRQKFVCFEDRSIKGSLHFHRFGLPLLQGHFESLLTEYSNFYCQYFSRFDCEWQAARNRDLLRFLTSEGDLFHSTADRLRIAKHEDDREDRKLVKELQKIMQEEEQMLDE